MKLFSTSTFIDSRVYGISKLFALASYFSSILGHKLRWDVPCRRNTVAIHIISIAQNFFVWESSLMCQIIWLTEFFVHLSYELFMDVVSAFVVNILNELDTRAFVAWLHLSIIFTRSSLSQFLELRLVKLSQLLVVRSGRPKYRPPYL